jgi:tetratricopeptide (TPR) repeat protein
MLRTFHRASCIASVAVALCFPGTLLAQDAFRTFDEAFGAGARLARNQQFAEAQAPLEAALKLAADDKDRLKAYQALVPSYRQLAEIDKMLEAREFIIRHTNGKAGRSNAAGDLASFLHQRGKTDVAIARYDAALKANADDIAALSVLAAIYTGTKRDKVRGPEFTKRLDAVNKQLARKHAEQLEKDAETAPRTAATILKDAAAAWIEADDKPRALAAAKKSLASLPEDRGDLLVYFWRRGLGDALLAAGEPAQAIEQFKAALAVVTIEGYRQDTEKQLAEAQAAAAKKP